MHNFRLRLDYGETSPERFHPRPAGDADSSRGGGQNSQCPKWLMARVSVGRSPVKKFKIQGV
jgi:hypothetical protein